MDIAWIKISTKTFDDEKIKLIESMPGGSDILLLWFKLLTLAGRNNYGGCVCLSESVPYTPNMLATLFNRPANITNSALKTFKDFGMIDIDKQGFVFILNWEKHQSEDKLLQIREQNRERVARYRANQKQKLLSNGCNVTGVTCNDNVTNLPKIDENKRIAEKVEIENLEQNQINVTLQSPLRNAIEIDNRNNIYILVLNFWNEQNIIKHRSLNKSTKGKINSKLKEYTIEEIKTAISNYSIILKGEEYFFNYKWTLKDFLERGFEKFIDLRVAKSNYSKQNHKVNNPQKDLGCILTNQQFTSEASRLLI